MLGQILLHPFLIRLGGETDVERWGWELRHRIGVGEPLGTIWGATGRLHDRVVGLERGCLTDANEALGLDAVPALFAVVVSGGLLFSLHDRAGAQVSDLASTPSWFREDPGFLAQGCELEDLFLFGYRDDGFCFFDLFRTLRIGVFEHVLGLGDAHAGGFVELGFFDGFDLFGSDGRVEEIVGRRGGLCGGFGQDLGCNRWLPAHRLRTRQPSCGENRSEGNEQSAWDTNHGDKFRR